MRPRIPELPPPVRPGDRVGVAALSGAVSAEDLEAGLDGLRALGYEPVRAVNLESRSGLFAGTDSQRLDAFHRLAGDSSLSAIFFARGGHGVLRLLPRIDWDLLSRRPRAYVGYSDLVPFLLEAIRRLGLVTFHGPMVGVDLARPLEPAEEGSLRGALEGRFPAKLRLAGARGGASVEGRLVGGCLSMLVSTLGTPHAFSLDEALLFWEDVNEPFYRVDRMLTQLRLSGGLKAIRGMIIGHMETAKAVGDLAGFVEPLEVAREVAASFEGPMGWGLDAGHGRPNLTLPLGLPARLDPVERRLTVGILTEDQESES